MVVVHRPEEFFPRLGRDQLIGFGEAYLTGAWDAEDLGGFLTVLAARLPHLVPERLQRLRGLVVRKPPADEVSSTENSPDNIAHHYDLSNDLFELFLDPTLSYSSALFTPRRAATGRRPAPTSRSPRAARSTGCSTRPASATAPGCSRSAPAGASWRSGPPAAVRPSRTITLSTEQKALADAADRRGRAARTGSRSSSATTATRRRASTTPSCRSR